ncbi:MAG: RNA polymerase sigma factor [Bacteroidaceae bacterium]|nr:RNA polymerase sigma factor [Bacteroidaceae bacterium]
MNRELFTKLVRKELSGLRRFLLAACSGNGDEADDVAQEALMKAYVASPSFEDEAGFSAWLYKIACNCLIDHQRKLTTRGVTLDIDKANDVAASSHTDDAFHYQDLYHAIDGLGMSERTAVLLFYMEDRSVKEIATMMNVAEGTVKAYLSRGREHLRNKLTNNQSRQI